MNVFERPYTDLEIQKLKERKHSAWALFEFFGTKWIGISLISFIIPFFLLENLLGEISKNIELAWFIISQVLTVGLCLFWMKQNGELTWNTKIEKDIANGTAKVFRIQSSRVIKRYDQEDFGSGYYFDIGPDKTLFLQGQDFDAYQYSRKFPSTDFELVRSSLNADIILDVVSFGKYLPPTKKLPAFSLEEYSEGSAHLDGMILSKGLDDLIK